MAIDKALLDKIAAMARLEFAPHEEEKMLQDLNTIADWVSKLCALKTTGVAPLDTMSPEVNVLRVDEPGPSLTHAQALHNAPSKDANYFRVPPVVNKDEQ